MFPQIASLFCEAAPTLLQLPTPCGLWVLSSVSPFPLYLFTLWPPLVMSSFLYFLITFRLNFKVPSECCFYKIAFFWGHSDLACVPTFTWCFPCAEGNWVCVREPPALSSLQPHSCCPTAAFLWAADEWSLQSWDLMGQHTWGHLSWQRDSSGQGDLPKLWLWTCIAEDVGWWLGEEAVCLSAILKYPIQWFEVNTQGC